MDFSHLNDQKLLQLLGERFRAARLNRDMSVAVLAGKTGLSAKTIQNLESGNKSVGLLNVIAVLRALDMLDELGNFMPEPPPRAAGTVNRNGRHVQVRQRASSKPASAKKKTEDKPWAWGEA